MASGKVKWFDNRRGYGFIVNESGKDVFVHHTSIQGEGFHTLQEGEEVRYELEDSGKGPKANQVQRLMAKPAPRPTVQANDRQF
ncbi:MAG: cold shock domain-containing protein [Verrucomicrobiota bacterium]